VSSDVRGSDATVGTQRGPLTGLRVIDFTWMVAGPFATAVLASLGAEVIKVESAGRLDALRRLPGGMTLPPGDVDSSPYFAQLNNNKLGVRLNLKRPEGVELAKRLIREADIVVEGFRGGVINRLGLGYEELRKEHDDLIMLSLSTNGATGPDAGLPGYAPIFAAVAGLGTRTGYRDGPPTELRVSVDVRVGYAAALAVLGAVHNRRATGRGHYIDFAAAEVVTAMCGDGVLEYQMTGSAPSRIGNDEPGYAPHDCYACLGTDSWVSIAVGDDLEWASLCQVIGTPDLVHDERYETRAARWTMREGLRETIESWTSTRTAEECTTLLQGAGVPAAPSNSYSALLADEHLRARGLFGRVPHALLPEGALVVGMPWKTVPDTSRPLLTAPTLGEHHGYVFGRILGMSEDEVAALTDSGVLD
jgi:crotonobetainyl-CoA:carnitine CoA-transferase CaiB-like acyl-CoA transferase